MVCTQVQGWLRAPLGWGSPELFSGGKTDEMVGQVPAEVPQHLVC